MLILGFLTPLAAAGVIGVMVVALITNHLKNGFFIFRPGEGYEYVLTLMLTGFALAGIGAGEVVDRLADQLDVALRLEGAAHRGGVRRRRRRRVARRSTGSPRRSRAALRAQGSDETWSVWPRPRSRWRCDVRRVERDCLALRAPTERGVLHGAA